MPITKEIIIFLAVPFRVKGLPPKEAAIQNPN
jgi:hypothetical protein